MHGHRFTDTIEQAEEDLQQFFLGEQKRAEERGGHLGPCAVHAWAWPLRWLRFRDADGGEQEAVIYVNGGGKIAAFRSTAAA